MDVGVAVLERVGGVGETDEVGRDQPRALVDELVERVLAVRARLAPEDLAGVGAHRRAVGAHGAQCREVAVGHEGEGVGIESWTVVVRHTVTVAGRRASSLVR